MVTLDPALPLGKAVQDFMQDSTTTAMDRASLSRFLGARPVRDGGHSLFDNITHRMELARNYHQWHLENSPSWQGPLSPTAWSILMVASVGMLESGSDLNQSLFTIMCAATRGLLAFLKT